MAIAGVLSYEEVRASEGECITRQAGIETSSVRSSFFFCRKTKAGGGK